MDNEITETLDSPAEDAAEGEMPPGPPAIPEGWERMPNLATVLPVIFLTSLGAIVYRDFETDWDSGKEWREQCARYLDLHNGNAPETMGDQENITIVHLPYVARAVQLFHSKMFMALYPPTGDFVALQVSRPALESTARRCGRHMNDALRNEIVEWVPSHDRGQKQQLIRGSTFEVWYYDELQERPAQEICLADDVVVPYKRKSDRVDMADVPRITWRKRYYLHELEELEERGYYVSIRKPNREAPALYPSDPYDAAGAPVSAPPEPNSDDPSKEVDNRTTGATKPTEDNDGQREILEQDRWLVLKPLGEKRARAVTVCIDRETQRVLRVTLREKDDPKDKKRYQADMQVHAERTAALQAHAQQQHEAATASHAEGVQFGMIHPETPPPVFQPPPALPPPPPIKRVPWHRWTHYICDVNPEGFYGHGVPHKVAGQNIVANKIATRAISLLTMTLLPTGIMSRQSKFARGETQIKLGKMNESPLAPAVVQAGAGLFFLKYPPPDPQWTKLIELMDASCQEQTAFDIAAGGPGMSGETATESENRHSSALDNVSMIASRSNLARANSLRNLAYIYSQTLPDGGVKVRAQPQGAQPEMPAPPAAAPPPPASPTGPPAPSPLDMMGPQGPPPSEGAPPGMLPPEMMQPPPEPLPLDDPEEFTVTREDYEAICDDMQVTFTCDPRLASRPQKVRDAMKGFQTMLQVVTTTVGPNGPPILDPITSVIVVREGAAEVMEAMDRSQVAKRIRSAPPPSPPPAGMPPAGPGAGPGGPPRKGSNGPNGPPPGAGMDGGGGGAPPGDAGGPPPP
jgi:hypothetical protein